MPFSDGLAAAESLGLLSRAGWSMIEAAFADGGRRVWVVRGLNGRSRIQATGGTRREAWQRAVERATEIAVKC
jgi:hypothetical protein